MRNPGNTAHRLLGLQVAADHDRTVGPAGNPIDARGAVQRGHHLGAIGHVDVRAGMEGVGAHVLSVLIVPADRAGQINRAPSRTVAESRQEGGHLVALEGLLDRRLADEAFSQG